MKKIRLFAAVIAAGLFLSFVPGERIGEVEAAPPAKPPIYISFLWHMHQPIYWPYDSVTQTQQNNVYSFDLHRTHSDRAGPYTSWPVDAVQAAMGSGLDHAGAQVSFSGSLMENLDDFERSGWGFFGWKNRWRESNWWKTSEGNPRLDLVGFGYHHPLLPLLDAETGSRQIGLHKSAYARAWNGNGAPHRPYSKGFFPPENAFAEWMIPGLVAEGVEWVMADNIHLQRACEGYPWTPSGGLIPPNRADQQNSDPGDWTQLRDLWAPTPVSAGWSFRPHYVRHVDPASGQASQVIVVPTARYMGNEDGRGGFGALQYEKVMQQIEFANNDPNHPTLIVLHHDGDNYGGGADSYYRANWSRFLDWARNQGHRFVPTTIQDYLDMFPPATDDVVHIEPGAWSGADNGDAEFKKWLGDPDANTGHSPDINSWAAMIAATNRVKTAGSLAPTGQEQARAWHFLLNGFASDYWYWDGTEVWDSNPTRAANEAVRHADQVLAGGLTGEKVGPQVFLPQREPYNPGAMEFARKPMPADFEVWTLAYDASGVRDVTLHYRVDADGHNPRTNDANETFAGGAGVGQWQTLPMQASTLPPAATNPSPSYRAQRYGAMITGQSGRLLDYYVEAVDAVGNTSRSPILHVYVGTAGASVTASPASITADQTVEITTLKAGRVHWGVDGWLLPDPVYQPPGSVLDLGALETRLTGPDAQGRYRVRLGPFLGPQAVSALRFVIRYDDGSWDNNGGSDYIVPVGPMPVHFAPTSPSWDQPVVIRAPGPGTVHWGLNGWRTPPAWARPAGGQAVGAAWEAPLQQVQGVYSLTLPPQAGDLDVTSIQFAIRWPDGTWDNAGGTDYEAKLDPKAVWWSPVRISGNALTVFTKTGGKVHFGHDGWNTPTDVALQGPNADGVYQATLVVPAGATSVELVIQRSDGSWDNNGGRDYRVQR